MIDDKITNDWDKAKQMYNNPDISESLKQVIENHKDKHHLHQELKELIMEWFWSGYYKGFEKGAESNLQ